MKYLWLGFATFIIMLLYWGDAVYDNLKYGARMLAGTKICSEGIFMQGNSLKIHIKDRGQQVSHSHAVSNRPTSPQIVIGKNDIH